MVCGYDKVKWKFAYVQEGKFDYVDLVLNSNIESFFDPPRALLERISPVLVDKPNLLSLLRLVDCEVRGRHEINAGSPATNGLLGSQLLLALATPYPGAFRNEESFG